MLIAAIPNLEILTFQDPNSGIRNTKVTNLYMSLPGISLP